MSASAKAYVEGRAAGGHEGHPHVTPVKTYLAVFVALLSLTVLTVLASYMNLGAYALGVAMVIAMVKAGFVVGYFMHLKYDNRFHSFIFATTLLFVGVFFVLTFFDLKTRDMMNTTWDSFQFARDHALEVKPALKDTSPLSDKDKAALEAEEQP